MDESAAHSGDKTERLALARRSLDELPGPPRVPLLGNALQLKPKQLHRIMSRWANQYGPLFVFKVAATRVLTVADAETIQQLLRERPDRFRRWRKMEEIGAEIKADGLFTAEGAAWRRQRKFVMHALNASHVREFVPRLEEVTARLRRRWWRAALAGMPVDAHTDLMRFTVDVTSGLAFGRDLNTLEEKLDPIQKHLDKLFPAIARRQTAIVPYWRYVPLPKDREVTVAVREVGKIIDGLIAETRARLAATPELCARPRNLLEALVVSQQQSDAGPRDDEIAANVMTLLLAGEDTTANTISWMIHFLMEHPRVQAAVQEEVDRVLGLTERGWGDPGLADRLPYIEAVANEAMRCKPVGGHLFLEPNEDVQIMDVHVPKGTPILVLNGHVGTQEINFSQAEEFRPERWLDAPEHSAPGHNTRAFMPFGAGPRFCPGRNLAMLQIKMVTAMLCRDFEVSRPAAAPPTDDVYNFTVGPTNVFAMLRPRRAVRRGIDIDLRVAQRRIADQPIAFPDRRLADRRLTDPRRRHLDSVA
jgi:cytochrome P450